MANDFRAWKAVPNFFFDKIGIRSVFQYNFKPLKNTSQKFSLFPQFFTTCQEKYLCGEKKRPKIKHSTLIGDYK